MLLGDAKGAERFPLEMIRPVTEPDDDGLAWRAGEQSLDDAPLLGAAVTKAFDRLKAEKDGGAVKLP